jgi:hypothetical protein
MYLFQFGTVKAPGGGFGGVDDLPSLINIILRTLIVGAGIYAVFNFVLAGYSYLSAGGDSKQVQLASAKITQSIIGLTVAAGSFVIAGIVGQLLFGDPWYLLRISYYSLK